MFMFTMLYPCFIHVINMHTYITWYRLMIVRTACAAAAYAVDVSPLSLECTSTLKSWRVRLRTHVLTV